MFIYYCSKIQRTRYKGKQCYWDNASSTHKNTRNLKQYWNIKLNRFRLTGRRSLLYWSEMSPWHSLRILIYGTIFRTHVSNEKRNSKTSVLTKQAEIKRLETSAGFLWWDKKNFVLINRRTGQFRKAKVCVEREFIYGWSRIKQENSLVCEVFCVLTNQIRGWLSPWGFP